MRKEPMNYSAVKRYGSIKSVFNVMLSEYGSRIESGDYSLNGKVATDTERLLGVDSGYHPQVHSTLDGQMTEKDYWDWRDKYLKMCPNDWKRVPNLDEDAIRIAYAFAIMLKAVRQSVRDIARITLLSPMGKKSLAKSRVTTAKIRNLKEVLGEDPEVD